VANNIYFNEKKPIDGKIGGWGKIWGQFEGEDGVGEFFKIYFWIPHPRISVVDSTQ
jgi:hypothetical protein